MLQRQTWDYVTIQQASIKSFEAGELSSLGQKFRDLVSAMPRKLKCRSPDMGLSEDDSFRSGDFRRLDASTPEQAYPPSPSWDAA